MFGRNAFNTKQPAPASPPAPEPEREAPEQGLPPEVVLLPMEPAAPEPVPEPAPEPEPEEIEEPSEQYTAVTYLACGAFLDGKLKVKGDLEVAGDARGELEAGGSVLVTSEIHSSVTAASLNMTGCSIHGDVRVSGAVTIDENSCLEGNVWAGTLLCSGTVKGNIKTSACAEFESTAVVIGSIEAGTIRVKCGACLNGMVSVSHLSPDKAPDGGADER